MVFLHAHGVSTSRAVRIFKIYGAEAVAVVRGKQLVVLVVLVGQKRAGHGGQRQQEPRALVEAEGAAGLPPMHR